VAPDGSEYPTVEFDIILPVKDDFLRDNIRHAMTLGLPEVDDRDWRLNIVANGPSAGGVKFDGVSMALNGAIRLFPPDSPPTFWCVSDPQELVADFLPDDPPRETTYLVASKCHRSVFEKLKDRTVKVWHLSDIEDDVEGMPGMDRRVPCATSVTLTALILAQRIGVRRIDVWGWDCAFGDDGSHHAGMGEMGITATTVDVRVGGEGWGKEFKTTPTWAWS
jgi:hypothetical protein